jgi:D-alanyl-D-alanine carboxypeptidase/D-alanyl-D-alanine-endopeptidase (penicillin-binding protein 4)
MATGRGVASDPPSARARRFVGSGALALAVLVGAAWPPGADADAPRQGSASAKAAEFSAPTRASIDDAAIQRAAKRFHGEIGELGASCAVAVWSLPDRRSLAAFDDEQPLNPASNAKLATSLAALSQLGPEHRFVTGLYGELRDGAVEALVLRGRGDPELDMAALVGLVRQLHTRGVARVGKVVVDQAYFPGGHVPPAFDQQPDEWASFRAPIAATSLERNAITLWLRPTSRGQAAVASSEPPGFVDFEGRVLTGAKDSSERVQLELSANGDRLVARLSGSVPEGSRPVPVVRRVDDPARLAGFGLAAALQERGIEFGGPVELGSPSTKQALALHRSRPLAAIVAALGKDSDNFTAEMLFAALGAASPSKTRSPSAGAAQVEAELRARGAFPAGTKIVNGSGLFDANRATARGIVSLLASAAADPRLAQEFVAHLAVAGSDGTLRNRMTKLREKRTLRAKTGTLAASIALSGYVLGDDGQPRLAFSFLVDGARGKTAEARQAIDRAASALADAVAPR